MHSRTYVIHHLPGLVLNMLHCTLLATTIKLTICNRFLLEYVKANASLPVGLSQLCASLPQ
jgi:hypothetical protein